MSGALKHKQRSHKTYRKNTCFRASEKKVDVARYVNTNKSILEWLKAFLARRKTSK